MNNACRSRCACLSIMVFFIVTTFGAAASPVSVKTARYQDVAYYPEHNTAAEVIARHDSEISAEIAAVVVNVNHDTGDKIRTGDTVIALDCRSYKLQLKQAQAAHEAVIAQLENARKLVASAALLQKQNNISQEEYNQRSADAARLQAESLNTTAGIENAKIAVDKCKIKAPYDGYISDRTISKGELVQAGTPVFHMITSEQGRVDAQINSFEYESFLLGADYEFVYNGVSYALAVDSILPVLDKNFRTHTARLSFTGRAAPTGSHGDLRWRDQQLALPSNLVVVRDNQAGVLVANSGQAKFIPVDGYIEGHPVMIELDADTKIITTGRHGLRDGDAIIAVASD
ncbi:MAG: efflux RND transporter periplasmic adaptor subunit [Gammaproteobacteria bacterium]